MKHKKAIPISIAGAVMIVVLMVMSGFLSRQDEVKPPDEDDRRQRLDRLRALPYMATVTDTAEAPLTGVLVHEPARTSQGYNFYGSGPSSRVILMDMTGQIVHLWRDLRENPAQFVAPVLLPNGDVIVVEKTRGILRLDWDSNVVWEVPMRAHHEIALHTDSTFYALERSRRSHRGLVVKFDTMILLTLAGNVVETWSTYDNLHMIRQSFDQRSFLDTILDEMESQGHLSTDSGKIPERLRAEREAPGSAVFDYFHTNRINILPETPLGKADRRFRSGNILTCLRNVNQIAILEEDTKEILWVWGEGELEWPHHPTMLENGNILIFDNGVEREFSRVIEINPRTGSVEWEYGLHPDQRFFSPTRGSAQRLPNGNTLICDSDNGRAFEVTSVGKIVWEWFNPETKDGRRLAVSRMIRLAPEVVEPLLAEYAPGP